MKLLKTIVFSFLAGLFVSIGGVVFLSVENKIIGALMFTVGLFVICTKGLNLFTGKVCYIFENDRNYALNLPIIWFGNLLGTLAVAGLVHATRISGISERAVEMCSVKLNDSLLSVFILAIFCNILIFVAVDGFKNTQHEIGKYLSLFFGVMVFILSGFEHCVANMFYISVAGCWSTKAVLFILVNTLGNAVGGILVPLANKLK